MAPEPRFRHRDPSLETRLCAAAPVRSRSSGMEPHSGLEQRLRAPRLRFGAAAPVWSPAAQAPRLRRRGSRLEAQFPFGAAAPAWSRGSGAAATFWSRGLSLEPRGSGAGAPVRSPGFGLEQRLRFAAAALAWSRGFGAAAPVWSHGSGLEPHFGLEPQLRSRGSGAAASVWSRGSGLEPRGSRTVASSPRLRSGAKAPAWSRGSGLKPQLLRRGSGSEPPLRLGAATLVRSRSSGAAAPV